MIRDLTKSVDCHQHTSENKRALGYGHWCSLLHSSLCLRELSEVAYVQRTCRELQGTSAVEALQAGGHSTSSVLC